MRNHTLAGGALFAIGIVLAGAWAGPWTRSGEAPGLMDADPGPSAVVELQVTDAMQFRSVPIAVYSTYNDMYEPHMAIGGTGTIWITGHTMITDTHRSHTVFSTDDGATWKRAPDPEPLPQATAALPVLGGRVGQGNEGGIAADHAGRAWLYDAAWVAGLSPLYGWCDDGARSCRFDPLAFDHAGLATAPCNEITPRFLDKPWVRFGHGKLLLANVGLPRYGVDETRAASMLGLYDPDTGEKAWNPCVGIGGMPGVPAIRDSDGMIAVPHMVRNGQGLPFAVVHYGTHVDAMSTSPLLFRIERSWQPCQLFNGYSDFSAAGTYYMFTALNSTAMTVAASTDLASFPRVSFDAGRPIRYMWMEGSKLGEGALISWGVADNCNVDTDVTFYAAHVALDGGVPVLRDVSVVDTAFGTCGHYMGNELGPDGRAYLVVHATPAMCLDGLNAIPLTEAPWRLYIQDAGPLV